MFDHAVHSADEVNVETVLRDELARGDAVAETVLPILRHLIAAEDSSVFSDEILARVRGMLASLSKALLDGFADLADWREPASHPPAQVEALTRAFLDNPELLAHLHAQALEWQLTERLQSRLSLDPVVSPLLQALISAQDGPTQDLAMKFLAAQARWCQSQRRMTLSLQELPGDLFHAVLVCLQTHMAEGSDMGERTELVASDFRKAYDEGSSRLGLASRLVLGMGRGGQAALEIGHAGVALFLTALALGSGQGRDAVVLSTHEAQLARLALALRTSGLKPAQVEQQFLALHPDVTLPDGFDRLNADLAAAILSSGRFSG
jgi:hypothetical protein